MYTRGIGVDDGSGGAVVTSMILGEPTMHETTHMIIITDDMTRHDIAASLFDVLADAGIVTNDASEACTWLESHCTIWYPDEDQIDSAWWYRDELASLLETR